jgi:hypothetical protein
LPRTRKPAELVIKAKEKQKTQPESGHGKTDNGENSGSMVDHASRIDRGDNTHGNAEDNTD